MRNLFNDMLKTERFPDNMKLADITPVFKHKAPLLKVNYKSFSVLPSISKIFEKLMPKIKYYLSNYLSPFLCAYRNNFSSQQALLSLTENSKKVLDHKRFGRVFIDLLTAKLYVYGFNKESLETLHSDLSNRWHRRKINKQFIS